MTRVFARAGVTSAGMGTPFAKRAPPAALLFAYRPRSLKTLLRTASLVSALVLLAGCSGSGATRALTPPSAAASSHRAAADSATAMPGDSATAMPGASLACAPALAAPGAASCTLAINVNVKPVSDPQTPAALIPGLPPAALRSAYGFPSANPGGVVAIVDAYDAPAAESDLAVYRAAFGLPPCTAANGCFIKRNERGASGPLPAPNPGWAQEIALDLEMVSAVCPNCSLLLIEADTASIDDLGTGVDTAASLGARAISNSYYSSEWSGESAEDAHYTHPGTAITASSGDSGTPSYPAVSAHVTAVGGTSLANGSETAWAYGGHGCSAYVDRPAWQPHDPCASRSAVDVAAVGDPQTGVAMFSATSGGWVVAGGTSVGAPIIAAAYALGTPAGPAFAYAHPAAFRPLAAGGYDAATGLGSPRGVAGL